MSQILKCDNCGGLLPSEDAECPNCAIDLPSINPPPTESSGAKPISILDIAFVLAFIAWAVMLAGSGKESLSRTGSATYDMRFFAPYSDRHLIYHLIGFYLAIASAAIVGYSLRKNGKSNYAWATLLIALIYVIPRIFTLGYVGNIVGYIGDITRQTSSAST